MSNINGLASHEEYMAAVWQGRPPQPKGLTAGGVITGTIINVNEKAEMVRSIQAIDPPVENREVSSQEPRAQATQVAQFKQAAAQTAPAKNQAPAKGQRLERVA